MLRVNELVAMEAIRQQKARYCRFLDTKQFDQWEALFKPDAAIVFYNPDGSILGQYSSIGELAPLARKVFGRRHTAHQLHNSEIQLVNEHVAEAIWSVADFQSMPGENEQSAQRELAFGFFYERWEQVDGTWKIASLELRRSIEHHL